MPERGAISRSSAVAWATSWCVGAGRVAVAADEGARAAKCRSKRSLELGEACRASSGTYAARRAAAKSRLRDGPGRSFPIKGWSMPDTPTMQRYPTYARVSQVPFRLLPIRDEGWGILYPGRAVDHQSTYKIWCEARFMMYIPCLARCNRWRGTGGGTAHNGK